jgi:hypothetical protein
MNKKIIFPIVFSLALVLSGCGLKPVYTPPVLEFSPTQTPTVVPTTIPTPTPDSSAAIKAAIIKKDNIKSEFTLTISHENADYASGQISFEDGGGMFLAAKINGQWQIVYSGNGSIDCKTIKAKYEFTPEMLKNFCD